MCFTLLMTACSEIDNNLPQVAIIEPEMDTSVTIGSEIHFNALATDDQVITRSHLSFHYGEAMNGNALMDIEFPNERRTRRIEIDTTLTIPDDIVISDSLHGDSYIFRFQVWDEINHTTAYVPVNVFPPDNQ